MNTSWLVGGALVLGLGACGVAGSSADEAGTGASDVTTGTKTAGGTGICAFPARTHVRPITDYYVTWDSIIDRETYLAGFLASMGLKRSARTSPLADLQAIVDELYPSIVAELPAETTGMTTPPQVVLVADPVPNAFAAGDVRTSPIRAPWILFVNEGLIDLAPPRAELQGVMAHELAHLMAKHQFPEAPAIVRRHYQIGDRVEASVIPSLETDDAAVHAFANQFEALVAFGGAYATPVLSGFPVRFSGLTRPIRYHAYFEALGGLNTPECNELGTKYAAFEESLRGHLSKMDYQIRIEGDDATAMATTVADVERAAHACVGNNPVTLSGLAANLELSVHPERLAELQTAQTEEELRKLVLDSEEVAVDEDPNSGDVVTKILTLGKKKQNELVALVANADIPVAKMRRYGEEAEADQIAVRVLRHARADVGGGGRFLLRTLDDATRTQCEGILARGEVPPFGGFAFLHPALCWRVFEAKAFASTLGSTCDAP